jgi:hypothetical protein
MSLVIDSKNKKMFFHIPKNAGSTVSNMFMRGYQDLNLQLGIPEHLKVLYDPATRIGLGDLCCRASEAGHWRYADIRAVLGTWVDECRLYAIVRNPWDKVVSAYHYGMNTNGWLLLGLSKDATFDQWLNRIHAFWRERPIELLVYGQHTYVVDNNGNVPPNMKLLRFENLRADVNAMHEEWGTPDTYRLPEKGGPHVNKAIRKPYAEYYTDATRNLVGQLFATDVRMFGYSYDDYLKQPASDKGLMLKEERDA